MYDCILLAAGASSRMGPEGAFKPLLSFGSGSLVEASTRPAFDAGCRVLLVLGCRAAEVASVFDAPAYAAERGSGRLELVYNPAWAAGMVGSVQAALPLVSGEAFFVAHADMPFVAAGDYLALASARDAAAGRGAELAAFFASWEGRAGHPVLLPSPWGAELLALGPGERLKPVLEGRPAVLVATGPSALCDIDTPGDYEAALTWLRRRS